MGHSCINLQVFPPIVKSAGGFLVFKTIKEFISFFLSNKNPIQITGA